MVESESKNIRKFEILILFLEGYETLNSVVNIYINKHTQNHIFAIFFYKMEAL